MLAISPIYASILVGLIVFLAYRVTIFRRSEAIALGDEKGSKAMKSAVRAHANAIENIPLALILLVIAEFNHLNPLVLHAFGILLVLSRFAHAWGLTKRNGPTKGRFYGTIFTWSTMSLLAITNLYLVIQL